MIIKNSIIINKDIDFVFKKTNDINNWKNLFSEYKESEVLFRKQDDIVFKLKNLRDNEWISWRNIDYENYIATAKRLYPIFPFKMMNLKWEYEKIDEATTQMTWIQEFSPHENFSKTEEEMEEFLDENTKNQQKIIKKKLESYE